MRTFDIHFMWTVLDRHTENDLLSLQDTPVGDITCTYPIFSGDTSNAVGDFKSLRRSKMNVTKKRDAIFVCVVSVLSGDCPSSLLVAGAAWFFNTFLAWRQSFASPSWESKKI